MKVNYFSYEPELAELDYVYLDRLFIIEHQHSTPTTDMIIHRHKTTASEYFHHADNEILKSGFRSIKYGNNGGRRHFQFRFNDHVCVNERKLGFVKYQGRVHFAEGYFCGIELEEREGKHDGQIDNIR
jgi:hypothetical protein